MNLIRLFLGNMSRVTSAFCGTGTGKEIRPVLWLGCGKES